MRYRIGQAIAELSDSRPKTAATTVVVGVVAGLVEYVTHTVVLQTHISEAAHAILDSSIVGLAVAGLVWFLFSATRVRRKRVLEHIRAVAELNHEVRNALQVIVHSQVLQDSEHTARVIESVQRIDTTLRTLFPVIGERVQDKHRYEHYRNLRTTLLRRRVEDMAQE